MKLTLNGVTYEGVGVDIRLAERTGVEAERDVEVVLDFRHMIGYPEENEAFNRFSDLLYSMTLAGRSVSLMADDNGVVLNIPRAFFHIGGGVGQQIRRSMDIGRYERHTSLTLRPTLPFTISMAAK